MSKKPLEFKSKSHDDETRIYTLSGNLFGSPKGYAFQDDVRERIGEGTQKVVVNLEAVDRIDSSGVGILVAVAWSANRAGSELVLTSLSSHVKNVMGLAMLLDHIDVAESVDQALASLNESPS